MREKLRTPLLIIVVLMIFMIRPVYAYPQSECTVRVRDNIFECTYSLVFIPGFDLDQFQDAEDAYGRFPSDFRAGLKGSILDAVMKASERTEGISVENLDVDRLEVNEESGKVYVTITFDLVGFISTSNGETIFDLTWRDFTASKKFSVGSGSNRYTIDPSEALALNFHKFSLPLRDWDMEVSSGITEFTHSEDYELETDLGDIDLETSYLIIIPKTRLTLIDGEAVYQEKQGETTTVEERPKIPGFTLESIITGILLGLPAIIYNRLQRRRRATIKRSDRKTSSHCEPTDH